MKHYLTQLLLFSCMLCTIISCKEDKKSSTETTKKSSKKTNGPFEIQSGVIEYEEQNLKNNKKTIYTLTFDDYGNVVKLEETVEGETSIYIYNDTTNKGATLFSGRDKPVKIYMRQGEISMFLAQRSTSGFVKQNDQEVLGKNCTVYANNTKTADGAPKVVYWLYKGLALKEINRLGNGYRFEAIKFEEKQIDREVFSLPNKIKLPHNIF